MALNTRQEKFINHYIVCGNATRAAIDAGYSERTARTQGSFLLTNPDIQAEISRRMAEEAMSANEVLWRLGRQARADLGDLITGSGDNLTIDIERAREWGLTDLLKKVTQRIQRRSTDDETVETITFTVELHDAQAALKEIGRAHKLFTDGLDVSGAIDVNAEAEQRIVSRIDSIAARLRTQSSAGGTSADAGGDESPRT